MGIRYNSSGAQFSVGMDCPNTILGGRNSIRVTSGSAKQAAQLANDSHTDDESVTVGAARVRVRRAAALGSTNYGICVIE